MNKRYLISALLMLVLSSLNIYAQFGKNKVQYEVFDWKYIQSSNFDIYYDDGAKYLAEYTAYSAEKALNNIEGLINYNLTSRVTIVLYNSHNEFQQTNVVMSFMPEGVGGVTELFKNRVVLPFQGDYAVFDHVIHHELVHAVLNDMFYGGSFQTAMSAGGGFFIPLWMNEGLAEYSSLYGMNTETDMYMRDLTISENLPEITRMNGYLAYRGGQTFYWYVAETYGEEKIADLINKLKIFRNLEQAFESTFHMSVEDFSEKFERDIKKIYWPDLTEYENPKDYAIQLTDHKEDRTYYNTSPAISPNGEKMAFISAPTGMFGIFIRDDLEDKSSTRKLVSSLRAQDFEDLNILTPGISWNPDGTKLAISAKGGGQDAVFIVDAVSGDYEKLTWGMKSIASVEWSPDGSKLAFNGSIVEKSDIFVYDLDSKELMNITEDIFTDNLPTWGPDSETIYFVSERSSLTEDKYTARNYEMWEHDVYLSDIYSANINSKEITRLTFDPENSKTSIAPVFTGDKLLYVSDKSGIGNVYELNLETLNSRPLTNSITGIAQISLSRDAGKLLFSTQINGGYDIFMLRFPLERSLEMAELPLTEFKEKEQKKQQVLDNIAESKDKEVKDEQVSVGYGDFEVDFDNQVLVEANPDAKKKVEKSEEEDKVAPEDARVNGEFVEHDYKIKFSPDIISGNPGFSTYYGVQGVTQMLFSDELGDHQIFFQANLLIDLVNSQFYLAYNYLPEIIDYQFSFYHTSAYTWSGQRGRYFRFRNFGGGVGASYPFSLFDRMELTADLMYVSKETLGDGVSINEPVNSKFIIAPEIRYVHDNTLWGYYGPNRGSRYYFGLQGSPPIGDNGVGFMTFQTDIRYYFPIGEWFSLAFRGAGAASFGPDPQNFFLGGTENWINRSLAGDRLPLDEPEDFAFMEFKMPMRGWPVGSISGNRYFLTNAEFRFPLLTALVAGPLPILIQGIMGAVFLDVGGAWNNTSFKSVVRNPVTDELNPNNLLMSTGLGIRSYLLGFPLKIDIAWRNEFHTWSEPYYMFSLGFDF